MACAKRRTGPPRVETKPCGVRRARWRQVSTHQTSPTHVRRRGVLLRRVCSQHVCHVAHAHWAAQPRHAGDAPRNAARLRARALHVREAVEASSQVAARRKKGVAVSVPADLTRRGVIAFVVWSRNRLRTRGGPRTAAPNAAAAAQRLG